MVIGNRHREQGKHRKRQYNSQATALHSPSLWRSHTSRSRRGNAVALWCVDLRVSTSRSLRGRPHPRRRCGFSVITFVPRYLHGGSGVVTFRPTTRRCPGWVWWFDDAAISRYREKHAFLYVFFHVQPKISKWRHFRSYRRFAAMFEQAELRGIPMGPNGPPNAKETA